MVITSSGGDQRSHLPDAGSGPPDAAMLWRRPRRTWAVPLAALAGYGLFAVAVHLRLLDDLDIAAMHAARPGGVWGPTQERASRVVDAFEPIHVAVPLSLVVAAACVGRRSLRPCAVMALVGVPVVMVTIVTKRVMTHWDPSISPVAHGSFPSGHMASAVTACGIVVLLLLPGTRWGWALPVAAGGVMGVALVLASVHPATDVLGAGLLTVSALTAATAARLGQWARGTARGTAKVRRR